MGKLVGKKALAKGAHAKSSKKSEAAVQEAKTELAEHRANLRQVCAELQGQLQKEQEANLAKAQAALAENGRVLHQLQAQAQTQLNHHWDSVWGNSVGTGQGHGHPENAFFHPHAPSPQVPSPQIPSPQTPTQHALPANNVPPAWHLQNQPSPLQIHVSYPS